MDAKEFLKQAKRWETQIECKEIEKQRWRDLAQRITAHMEGERVQSSGTSTKLEDAVTACVDIEEEIVAAVEELIVKKKEVTQTIERVQNPTWYKVLHMIYIQYKDLNDVADAFNKSYDWAKSAHSKALNIVQRIIEE